MQDVHIEKWEKVFGFSKRDKVTRFLFIFRKNIAKNNEII